MGVISGPGFARVSRRAEWRATGVRRLATDGRRPLLTGTFRSVVPQGPTRAVSCSHGIRAARVTAGWRNDASSAVRYTFRQGCKTARSVEIEVALTKDHLERLAQTQPLTGIIELIWNALDADATEIKVEFGRNELDGIEEIRVIDNGHGMVPDVVERAFGALGCTRGGRYHGRSATPSDERKDLGKLGLGVVALQSCPWPFLPDGLLEAPREVATYAVLTLCWGDLESEALGGMECRLAPPM